MGKPLQIRDVPDDVLAALKAKADRHGLPLSAYALRVLARDAALPTMHRNGSLSERGVRQARHKLGLLPMRRYPHAPFGSRIWELRDNLTVYDAVYVALAEALGARLLTSDARLARAPGARCEIEVLDGT